MTKANPLGNSWSRCDTFYFPTYARFPNSILSLMLKKQPTPCVFILEYSCRYI